MGRWRGADPRPKCRTPIPHRSHRRCSPRLRQCSSCSGRPDSLPRSSASPTPSPSPFWARDLSSPVCSCWGFVLPCALNGRGACATTVTLQSPACLLQSIYLIGVYYGIFQGVSIGVMALIVGLQPSITGALVGPFLRESVSRRQWLGLALGFGGLSLVVAEKIALGEAVWFGYVLGLMGLVTITAGTLYQKKFCAGFDVRTTVAIQNAVSCVLMLALASMFETMEVSWTGEYLFALLWSAVALSVIAIMVFYYLVARGAATKVTSLIYLSPPTTAVMGWLVFDETLAMPAIVGMVVAVVGVAMVSGGRR